MYGSSASDFNLVTYSTGAGAVPFSIQNMAQTLTFDDRGAVAIRAAQEFGNFTQSTLTNSVAPFVRERGSTLTYSSLNRNKSQYRLFFSDGSGLYITIVNGKLMGCMPVYFPNPVFCAYEGKKTTGEDIMYFGSTDGMVYQMERGPSFDGADIEFFLQLNFSSAKSPRTLKRYRAASIEIAAERSSQIDFYFSYILGYDSAEYNQASSIPYSKFAGSARWDNFTWDNFFWDSANGTEPVRCELDGTAENIALYFSGSTNYTEPFSINSILIHNTPRRMMR